MLKKKKEFVFRQPLRNKDKKDLKFYGEMILKELREEARRAGQLFSAVPRTEEFINSFSYKITEEKDIIIYSTWEHIKYHLKNRSPYQMNWLKTGLSEKRRSIPMKSNNGDIVFRTLPLVTEKSWVHPAIVKFSWIEKAIDRAVMQTTSFLIYEKISGIDNLKERKLVLLKNNRKQARFKALTKKEKE